MLCNGEPKMSKCKCNLREKLVGDGCEVCNPTKALEYAKDTIAELESRLREIESWIPVTDRLPERWKPVLVACGAEIMRAIYTRYGWIGDNILYCSLETAPTHWMPLPEGPHENQR
jgi:hypothetical protein